MAEHPGTSVGEELTVGLAVAVFAPVGESDAVAVGEKGRCVAVGDGVTFTSGRIVAVADGDGRAVTTDAAELCSPSSHPMLAASTWAKISARNEPPSLGL
jgi:hypothetical protein